MKTALMVFGALLLFGACTHGGVLVDERGVLRNGVIDMRSFGSDGSGKAFEQRRIVARDGQVRCTMSGRDGEFEGVVERSAWEDLWAKLLAHQPFNAAHLDVNEADAAGGPYHLVRLDLDKDHMEFSAQNRADFGPFTTQAVRTRVELTNAIVLLVERAATTPVKAK
jgi:hypothetical protein